METCLPVGYFCLSLTQFIQSCCSAMTGVDLTIKKLDAHGEPTDKILGRCDLLKDASGDLIRRCSSTHPFCVIIYCNFCGCNIDRLPNIENGFQIFELGGHLKHTDIPTYDSKFIPGAGIDWQFRTEMESDCTKWTCAITQVYCFQTFKVPKKIPFISAEYEEGTETKVVGKGGAHKKTYRGHWEIKSKQAQLNPEIKAN